jgi:hypothetical protein
MPPANAPAIPGAAKEAFIAWLDGELHRKACADGVQAPPWPIRRMNRAEYSATMRDLLGIHVNAAQGLPADGAGGEGFDNAAETLFISPVHAEKYLEAARMALGYAFKDPKSRAVFWPAGMSEAAMLPRFLRRAFRRPVSGQEIARYEGVRAKLGLERALEAVLLSPHFLFHLPLPGDFALASRLSYFLWGSMPDDALFELAESGRLHEEAALRSEVDRLAKDLKSREFTVQFIEQWLNLRELGRDIKPDLKLYPAYADAEIQSAMRYEPALFFQELISEDLPLLLLLDSDFTIVTNKLARHYGLDAKGLRQQPVRHPLPPGSPRGGLLGMAGVLAVSSLPHRTSPVLRGKWILDAILGTPPPPPPPNVPALEEAASGGAAPATLRERLARHRADAVCANCHAKIDPLGFALENYDVLGRWRETDGGARVDARGELPSGETFEGPAGLKKVLLARKDLFLRNLTAKLLGYALGRSLTLEDQCEVERITKLLPREEYRARTLLREIVFSIPFRAPAAYHKAGVASK